MGMTFDTILMAGLLLGFILPAMAVVSATLPPPQTINSSVNVSQMLNTTGIYIAQHLNATYSNFNNTLIGKNGSFSANPTIFQAFAFIIPNLITVMLDVVQLPYLDYLSLNMITVGLSTVLPGVPLGFVVTGTWLLYIYMGISMLLLGVSMVMKYNARSG